MIEHIFLSLTHLTPQLAPLDTNEPILTAFKIFDPCGLMWTNRDKFQYIFKNYDFYVLLASLAPYLPNTSIYIMSNQSILFLVERQFKIFPNSGNFERIFFSLLNINIFIYLLERFQMHYPKGSFYVFWWFLSTIV